MTGKEVSLAAVPRSQRNDNFIDKSFTVMADLNPQGAAHQQAPKKPSPINRDGMMARATKYAKPWRNYENALTARKTTRTTGFHPLQHGPGVHHAMGMHQKASGSLRRGPSISTPTMPRLSTHGGDPMSHLGSLLRERGDTDGSDVLLLSAPRILGQGDPDWLRTTHRGHRLA